MALPDWSGSFGMALVRQDPEDEWHFVCWVTGDFSLSLEILEPGTHRFELWEVIGSTQTEAVSVSYDGPVRMGVIQMHR